MDTMILDKVNYDIGFIGAGNMAQAIGLRLISEGVIKPSNLIVSARTDNNLSVWSEKGVRTTNNNLEVVKNADIIFIAVKPQYFEEAILALSDKNGPIEEFKLFVSVMAGITIERINYTFRKNVKNIPKIGVVRVMPNTPCLVGSGCSVLCHCPSVPYDKVHYVLELMRCTGTCDVVPEHLFNSVSAICGSGPAYVYMVIESLADGGVRRGVPRDLAMKLAAQMVNGAAKMVIDTGKHPGQLKDEVCSPGGTTIAAVHELEKGSLRCTFINAVSAAADRAIELSNFNPN